MLQIDHRGAEDVLEKAFSNIVSQVSNPNIRYERMYLESQLIVMVPLSFCTFYFNSFADMKLLTSTLSAVKCVGTV